MIAATMQIITIAGSPNKMILTITGIFSIVFIHAMAAIDAASIRIITMPGMMAPISFFLRLSVFSTSIKLFPSFSMDST